jgi:hypothetical protein
VIPHCIPSRPNKKVAHYMSQQHVKHLIKVDFPALLLVQTDSPYLISNKSYGTLVAAFGSPQIMARCPPRLKKRISLFLRMRERECTYKIMDLSSTDFTYVGTILYSWMG